MSRVNAHWVDTSTSRFLLITRQNAVSCSPDAVYFTRCRVQRQGTLEINSRQVHGNTVKQTFVYRTRMTETGVRHCHRDLFGLRWGSADHCCVEDPVVFETILPHLGAKGAAPEASLWPPCRAPPETGLLD